MLSHLTLDQRSHLERRLLEERARVQHAIDRSVSAVHADADAPAASPARDDRAEPGSDTLHDTLGATRAPRETITLALIDAALRRLHREAARFGVDEITGEPIPFTRLDLVPWTRRGVGSVDAPGERRATRGRSGAPAPERHA